MIMVCLRFNPWKCFQFENETVPDEESKEQSDEEDDDDDGGRIRFKSERTDNAVVRLADAGNKRRNIPETLGSNLDSLLFHCNRFTLP